MNQLFDRGQITKAGGPTQWGIANLIFLLGIGSGIKQSTHDLNFGHFDAGLAANGEHQRVASHPIGFVQLVTGVEKSEDHLFIAPPTRLHQRGLVRAVQRIGLDFRVRDHLQDGVGAGLAKG